MQLLDRLRLSHKFLILGGIALVMMALPAGLYLHGRIGQMQALSAQARTMPARIDRKSTRLNSSHT